MAAEDRQRVVQRAQKLITEAMDLLDAHDGCQPAAAHLALALEELRRHVQRG
jgi:hypothetical protein